jgi:hypothetical protein
MLMNNGMERIWKGFIVASVVVLSRYLPLETGETTINLSQGMSFPVQDLNWGLTE